MTERMKKQTKRRPSSVPNGAAGPPSSPRLSPVPDREALELVMEMMAVPGRSGQEGAIVELIVDGLRDAGLPESAIQFDQAHLHSPLPGEVGNLVVKLAGRVRRPRRMLMAHVDTVPICVGSRPVLRGGAVRSAKPDTGLGADDRAGAAVLLSTALGLLRGGVAHPPLTFVWCVQEEYGLQGSRRLQRSLLGRPQMAFNFDGGGAEKITIGATSGYRMAIEVRGLASHAGGAPQDGVSAIVIAAKAIAELDRTGWHGAVVKGAHCGTSNVGVIRGGEATNVVTDRVYLRAEARSHETRFREKIVRHIERAFQRAAHSTRNAEGQCGEVQIEGHLDYEAFRLAPHDPCVKHARAAIEAIGGEPVLAIANGGLDANWTNARGIPTVSLGCGQRNIHTTREQLDVAQYQLARRIAWQLATETG